MKRADSGLQPHYLKADRVMLGILWGLAVYGLALATVHDTWWPALLIGGGTLLALHGLHALVPGTPLLRGAMGAAFMVMTALHIHQGHGMIEMHFGVFVCLALLLYYRDWMPVVAAAAVIAVHHFLFYWLQTRGGDVWVLQSGGRSWGVIFVHAGYVVVETAVLVLMAVDLRRGALQSAAVTEIAERLTGDASRIDLGYRHASRDALTQRLNQFLDLLERVVGGVAAAAASLNASSAAVSRHTADISEGSRQQQLQTDMIATASEEMAVAVREVSANAEMAASAATSADRDSKAGIEALYQTRQEIQQLAGAIEGAGAAVDRLARESDSIGSVVDVIRGIAEQTNLLALNAAIEAARAGEQGRGFAVVADEVRSLASRTQQSTEEIRQMIDNLQKGSSAAVSSIQGSQSSAVRCVELTQQAVTLLESVTAAVNEISRMNQLIAAATHQQAAVTGDVSRNVAGIKSLADSNSGYASTAAESSRQLVALANELEALIGQFQLSRH